MKASTLGTYQSSPWARCVIPSEGKKGKTCFTVASLLGVFPGQSYGGIVTSPRHLHILTFDSAALEGLKGFLLRSCNAPSEVADVNVMNFEADSQAVADKASGALTANSTAPFFESVLKAVKEVGAKARSIPGSHALLFSSVTFLAASLEREVMGRQDGNTYASVPEWQILAARLAEIRNVAQMLPLHVIWEAHIYVPPPNPMAPNAPVKESLQLSGKGGAAFINDVSQIFRLRRLATPGTKVQPVELDCRNSLNGVGVGRGFTEKLEPVEKDLTACFLKLGLEVGHCFANEEMRNKALDLKQSK